MSMNAEKLLENIAGFRDAILDELKKAESFDALEELRASAIGRASCRERVFITV